MKILFYLYFSVFFNHVSALNPLTSTDCELCVHSVEQPSNTIDAACKVAQAKNDEIVDAEWKLHSAAMLAKDRKDRVLNQIRDLSDSGVSAKLICGFLGVTSHDGGCVCPLDLAPFHQLGETLRTLSSDNTGSSLHSVKSALSCNSKDSVSLLELGRRTRLKKQKTTTTSALIMMGFDGGCTGSRRENDGDQVKNIKNAIIPGAQRTKDIADAASAAAMALIGGAIGVACLPCATIFTIVWGTLNSIAKGADEDHEKLICQRVIELAHRALTTKQFLIAPDEHGAIREGKEDDRKISVWDLLRTRKRAEAYVHAVNDLGGSVLDAENGSDPPVPELLQGSDVKSTVNFLLNVVPIPGSAKAVRCSLPSLLT